jgi:two-component system cell cycle response regulator
VTRQVASAVVLASRRMDDELSRNCVVVAPRPAPRPPVPLGAFLFLIATRDKMEDLGARFDLTEEVIRIGRGSDCHVFLDGRSVSRRHARIEQRGGRFWLVEDGSMNGTFVNGARLDGEWVLTKGDRIKIGTSILKFLPGEDPAGELREENRQLALIEGLTGALTTRAWLDDLRGRFSRREQPFSTVAFAVRSLDAVCDDEGDQAGDFVVVELARIARGLLPSGATIGRTRLEELSVTLPASDAAAASGFEERLRKAVAASPIVYDGQAIPVSLDTRVETCTDEDPSSDAFVDRVRGR